jgi:hypothetical protein
MVMSRKISKIMWGRTNQITGVFAFEQKRPSELGCYVLVHNNLNNRIIKLWSPIREQIVVFSN